MRRVRAGRTSGAAGTAAAACGSSARAEARDRTGVAQGGQDLADPVVRLGAADLDVLAEVGEQLGPPLGGESGGLAGDAVEIGGHQRVVDGVHADSPCGSLRKWSTASRNDGHACVNSVRAARPRPVSV
ncbi:hypothetical protein GCM10019017_20480 [Streptomyces showdoensis]